MEPFSQSFVQKLCEAMFLFCARPCFVIIFILELSSFTYYDVYHYIGKAAVLQNQGSAPGKYPTLARFNLIISSLHGLIRLPVIAILLLWLQPYDGRKNPRDKNPPTFACILTCLNLASNMCSGLSDTVSYRAQDDWLA